MTKSSKGKGVNPLFIPFDGPGARCPDCGVKFVWQTFHYGMALICTKCYRRATTDELLNRDNLKLKADVPTPMVASPKTKKKDRSDMDDYLGEGCSLIDDREVH